jgi:hypothetical protein
LLTFLILASAACGGDVVIGGFGEVETYATSSPTPAPSQSLGADEADPLAPSLVLAPAAVPQGMVEFSATVLLVDRDGQAVRVTDGPITARYRLSVDTIRLGRMLVPPGRYSRIQLRFENVSVDLAGGVTIPGIPLPATITVGQGTQPIFIEINEEVEVRADERVQILIDLNAAQWLAAADPLSRIVPEAAFRQAVRVRVTP